MSPTRILVVEQHVLLAESLVVALRWHGWDVHRLTLEDHPDVPLERLTHCALEVAADVVVLEPLLGRCSDGDRLVRPLTRSGAAVVVLTEVEDRARWGGWLRDGARCVVPKSQPLSKLLEVLRRLEEHRPAMPAEQWWSLTSLSDRQVRADDEDRRRLADLTPREREVLGELMRGLTIREIAEQSAVSDLTVRTQVRSILAKLDAGTQIAAVGLAHRVGWQPGTHPPGHSTRRIASVAPTR